MSNGVGDARALAVSERWFRLLRRFYPVDFRDEFGEALLETYRDAARTALDKGGPLGVARVWGRAFIDSLFNGLAERIRPAAAWRRAGNWGRDMELATRRLARAPLFAVTTIATLSIGLGIVGTVYTAIEKILIARLPYREPDDLYAVWREDLVRDLKRGGVASTDIAALQNAGGDIESAVGLERCWCGVLSLRPGMAPIEIAVAVTTPNIFDVLGVTPAIGRGFARGNTSPRPRRALVVSHELWTRLGADSALVGSEVLLNGQLHTVVGVLPRSFRFARPEATGPPQAADAYTVFDFDLAGGDPHQAYSSVVIRARHGASPNDVASAVAAVGRMIDGRYFVGHAIRLYAVPIKDDLVAPIRSPLVALGIAGAVLLFMLLVNLASILFARAAQRRHEFGISSALGADHAAIARAMLFEGAALGAIGGMLAALAVASGARALVALTPLDLPRRDAMAADWGIAGVIVAIGLVIGFLAGTPAALWAARAKLSSLLAGSGTRPGGVPARLRRAMVVAQVALTITLLSSSAIVLRAFQRLLHENAGFSSDGVLTFLVRTPPEFYPDIGDAIAFQDRLQQELSSLPGVINASAAATLPLSSTAPQTTVARCGSCKSVLVDVVPIRAGYIEAMRMRVVGGRTFHSERRRGVFEAVIDQSLAKRVFTNRNPLGATIPYTGHVLTVIGVVEQARLYDVDRDGRPQLLVRAEDFQYRPLYYVARTAGDPRSLIPDVRTLVRRLDGRVAVGSIRTLDEIVNDSLHRQRSGAILITALAVGAAVLMAMGLFAVVSGAVTRRRQEVAVRMAVGATPGAGVRLVLGEGALMVGAGFLIGLPGVYVAGRIVQRIAPAVSPWDSRTLLAVTGCLAVVTVATCFLPAWRVLKIDPAQLLRAE